jgi:hypothetical protein
MHDDHHQNRDSDSSEKNFDHIDHLIRHRLRVFSHHIRWRRVELLPRNLHRTRDSIPNGRFYNDDSSEYSDHYRDPTHSNSDPHAYHRLRGLRDQQHRQCLPQRHKWSRLQVPGGLQRRSRISNRL